MPEEDHQLRELTHLSSRREQPAGTKEKLKMSSSAPPRLQRVSVTELATVSVYSLFSTVGEPPASWMEVCQ